MALIKIIVGSTRDNRFGIHAAHFMLEVAQKNSNHTFEIVDLKELGLPMMESALPPSMANRQYDNDKAMTFSKLIDDADGFIFVTPEYNHAYPASLKNAIDTLAIEWANKPAGFVSYGVDGGIRAIEALRPVIAWLQVHDLKDYVSIKHFAYMTSEGGWDFKPTEEHIADAERVVTNVGYWADVLKDGREKLAAS